LLNGEGLWIVSDAVKYAASQIVLLSKLKLKEKDGKETTTVGIRMKAEGYKTRFTLPFQVVTIEVPYETGMDPISGLKDTALEMGVVVKNGSYYRLANSDEIWYEKDMAPYVDEILKQCEAKSDQKLIGTLLDEVEDTTPEPSAKSRRAAKSSK
jgi:hypothetical protein